jgi:hypothetical protein
MDAGIRDKQGGERSGSNSLRRHGTGKGVGMFRLRPRSPSASSGVPRTSLNMTRVEGFFSRPFRKGRSFAGNRKIPTPGRFARVSLCFSCRGDAIRRPEGRPRGGSARIPSQAKPHRGGAETPRKAQIGTQPGAAVPHESCTAQAYCSETIQRGAMALSRWPDSDYCIVQLRN